MAGNSAPVSSLPSKGVSTTRTPWLAGGCSTSGLAVAPPEPSSSDQAGEPCAPPPGETGSLASLLSSSTTGKGGTARVTSDPASTVTTGIATITAVDVLTTGQEDATPIKEGHAATSLLPPSLIATHHRLGLHSSRTGGGEIPSPTGSWPLQKRGQAQVSHTKKLNYEGKWKQEYIPKRKRQNLETLTG